MAKIRIRRGNKAGLPELDAGEPYLATDTNECFIGNGSENIQFSMMGDEATLLASNLSDASGTYLTESAYNFRFLAFEVDIGRNILVPMFDNQTAVFGSLSEFTMEAYDTYMFGANISNNGNTMGDNRNVKITTLLGNPAQTTYNTFTVTNIYGLCRISS